MPILAVAFGRLDPIQWSWYAADYELERVSISHPQKILQHELVRPSHPSYRSERLL